MYSGVRYPLKHPKSFFFKLAYTKIYFFRNILKQISFKKFELEEMSWLKHFEFFIYDQAVFNI